MLPFVLGVYDVMSMQTPKSNSKDSQNNLTNVNNLSSPENVSNLKNDSNKMNNSDKYNALLKFSFCVPQLLNPEFHMNDMQKSLFQDVYSGVLSSFASHKDFVNLFRECSGDSQAFAEIAYKIVDKLYNTGIDAAMDYSEEILKNTKKNKQ